MLLGLCASAYGQDSLWYAPEWYGQGEKIRSFGTDPFEFHIRPDEFGNTQFRMGYRYQWGRMVQPTLLIGYQTQVWLNSFEQHHDFWYNRINAGLWVRKYLGRGDVVGHIDGVTGVGTFYDKSRITAGYFFEGPLASFFGKVGGGVSWRVNKHWGFDAGLALVSRHILLPRHKAFFSVLRFEPPHISINYFFQEKIY